MAPLRRIAGAIVLACIAGGCINTPKTKPPYTGPTDPIADVVAKINSRNGRVDKLRGEGRFSANLIDPQTKKATSADGDITLLYMPQRNLRLVGKVLGTPVFDIGSNEQRFWLKLRDRSDTFTLWWGSHRLIGGQKLKQLPVRPDLLADVLAVGPIDTDLLKEPAPVMRFNNDQDAYMFTWQVQLPDRWVVQKEIWYDRQTLLPKLVLLFDENGRIVLRGYLQRPTSASGFEPTIETPSVYDLFFPDTGSTFRIEFSEWQRQNRGVPTPRSFNFPGEGADIANVVPLDD